MRDGQTLTAEVWPVEWPEAGAQPNYLIAQHAIGRPEFALDSK